MADFKSKVKAKFKSQVQYQYDQNLTMVAGSTMEDYRVTPPW